MLPCCWGELVCCHAYAREKWCLCRSGHLSLSCAVLSLESSCVPLLEPILEHRHRFCKLPPFALMHIHKKHVALFVVQDSWTCMFSYWSEIGSSSLCLFAFVHNPRTVAWFVLQDSSTRHVLSLRFIRDHFIAQRCRFRSFLLVCCAYPQGTVVLFVVQDRSTCHVQFDLWRFICDHLDTGSASSSRLLSCLLSCISSR